MTDAPAWVDTDEDVLRTYAAAFSTVLEKVEAQEEKAKGERSQLFNQVGVWSGGGAIAADGAFEERISDLAARGIDLQACVKLFNDAHEAIVDVKGKITEIVNEANEYINEVQNSELENKDNLINSAVALARDANIALIAMQAGFISGEAPKFDLARMPGFLDLMNNEDPGGAESSSDELVFAQSPMVPASNTVGGGGDDRNVEVVAPTLNADSESLAVGNNHVGAGGTGANEVVEMPTSDSALDHPATQNTFVGDGRQDVSESTSPGVPLPQVPSGPAATSPPEISPMIPGVIGRPGPSSAPGSGGLISSSMSGSGSAGNTATPSASGVSAPADPTAAPQQQLAEFQKAMTEATKAAVGQQPFIPPPAASGPTPAAAPPAAPASPVETAARPAPAPTPPPAPPATAGGGLPGGGVPMASPGMGGPGGAPMPLGPPPTPAPAAPVASSGAVGPAVPTAAAAGAGSGAVAAAPVPVSAKRAERDAVAGLLRRASGSDPLEAARRIGAALNVGVTDPRFFWMTGLTTEGSILVANNYGVGYIPDGVSLPDQVTFVSADESISAQERGKWATYPVMALHGWVQAHGASLRAVIATEEQFKGTDPGAAVVVLEPDDLPADGRMEGRSRLAVIAPDVAAKLEKMSDQTLPELLPPAPVDPEPPENRRTKLLMEVFRPLLSSDPGRAPVQLQAMIVFTNHMQELALHRAHTATDVVDQRAAIGDWIYWQHLAVLTSDAVGGLD